MFFAGLAVMLLGTWPLKVCWLGTSWESGWERRLLAQKRRKQALKEAVWGGSLQLCETSTVSIGIIGT